MKNIPELVLALPFASVLSSATKDESGSNRNTAKAQPSTSRCLSEETQARETQILIVEDNPADIFLIRRALKLANVGAELIFAGDGEEAMRIFDQIEDDENSSCLDLILLDINLPKLNGNEVIRRMRSRPRCGQAKVLIVTSSDSIQDREEMNRFGASGYFNKSSELEEFMKLGPLVQDLLGERKR
jgi:CheY-like chemotaxis protein